MHVTMAVHCVATVLLFGQTELSKPEVGSLEPGSPERVALDKPGFFLSDPVHVGHWVVCRIGVSDESQTAVPRPAKADLLSAKKEPADKSSEITVEWPGLLALDLNTGRALQLMAPRTATPTVTNWVDGNLRLGPDRCGAIVVRFERDGKKMGKVLDTSLWEWNLEQNSVVSAGPWNSARMVATLLDPQTMEVALPKPDVAKTDTKKIDTKKTDIKKTDTPKTSAAKTDAPKTVAAKAGAPKASAPKASAPKTVAPKTGAPKTGDPKTGTAKIDAAKSGTAKTDPPKTDVAKADATKSDAEKEESLDSATLEIRDKQTGRATQCPFDGEPVLLEPPSPAVADGAPTLIPCVDRRSFVVLNSIPSSEVMKSWRLECVDPRAAGGRRWKIAPGDVQKVTGFAPTDVFPVPGTAADFDHFVVQAGSADEKQKAERSHLLTIDSRTGQIIKAVRLPDNPASQEVDSLFASLHGSLAVFRSREVRKPDQPEAPVKVALSVFDVNQGSIRARFDVSKLQDVIPFGFDERGRFLGFSDVKGEIWRFTVDKVLHAERLFQLHPTAPPKRPAPDARRSSTKRVLAP